MLSTYKSPTDLENNINNTFKLYKKSIVSNFLSEVNEEQLKGESTIQYSNFNIYLAIYLVTLVFLEVKKYPTKSWDYFVTKYKLHKLKECLSCKGIKLEDILTQFQLPMITGEGIDFLEIENTLQIEPGDLTPIIPIINQINILTLINNSNCTINITKCQEIRVDNGGRILSIIGKVTTFNADYTGNLFDTAYKYDS
jgi:hypothetical protein